jgi:homoserine kinase
MKQVVIRVPATSANLGPGFDVLGLALSLYNRIILSEGDPVEPVVVETRGEGEGLLESGAENLAYRAVLRLFEEVGAEVPPLHLLLENEIPVSRGLGSSSAAIVGGLAAANAWLGEPLDREHVLHLAVDMEGHPDNVAPALMGGLQICSLAESGLVRLAGHVHPSLRIVVCIPEAKISTHAARSVLPPTYSRADAVFNTGRAALLVAGLASGDAAAVGAGMEDRLHQPYRGPLVPGFEAALADAREAGALGACLSGSGSTMLALTRNDSEPTPIGEAMVNAVRAGGSEARWLALDIDHEGACVEPI